MKKALVKKWLMLTIALVMVMVIAAACGSNSDNKKNDTATPPPAAENKNNDPANDPAEEEPVSDAVDLGGYTIRIAANADHTPTPDSKVGQQRIELQEEVEKKWNVKIEYILVPQTEFIETMTTSILAGEPAAEIWHMGSPGAVPALASKGLILPIDDYMDLSKETDFNVEGLRAGTSYQGKMYGLGATAVDAIGIFYNKQIFENAGLPDPHEWVATKEWTWEKFHELAKQFTVDTNGDGENDQWGLAAFWGDFAWFLILANNGAILHEDGTQGLTDPNTIEALDLMAKLYTTDKVIKTGNGGWGDQRTFFPEGNIAMVPGFSWEGGGFKTSMAEYGWGFLPLPIMPQADDYVNPARQLNVKFFAKGIPYPAETMQIFKELQVFDDEANETNYLNAQYENEDDIEIAYMLRHEKVVYDMFAGIPGQPLIALSDKLAKGEQTAAEAVEAVKDKFQADIDAVFLE